MFLILYLPKQSIGNLMQPICAAQKMPKNKSYDDRKQILNEMFRTRPFPLQKLIERVSEKLGKSVSKKTIQNDIRAIKKEAEEKGAALTCINGKYVYEPRNFNLYEVRVDPAYVDKIRLAAAILKQIPGLDLHEDMKHIFEKLEMRAEYPTTDVQEYIQFDTRPQYTGAAYLDELLDAIRCQTVVSFNYQPFNHNSPMRITVHPYLLKEFNNRWFLIGLPQHMHIKGEYELHKYGLERIQGKIVPERIGYVNDHALNAARAYKNVIGITTPKTSKVQEIKLRFTAIRARYIETNPLHPTQELIKQTVAHKTFSFQLMPNPELEALILSFGPDVEVLSPPKVRKDIKRAIDRMGKYYDVFS